jgi:hypothetical protein
LDTDACKDTIAAEAVDRSLPVVCW